MTSAAELRGVARPDGVVAIVEHNASHSLTGLLVAGCRLDRNVHLLGRRRAIAVPLGASLTTTSECYIPFVPWPNGP